MKITLDLGKLVEDGMLTPAEAARLQGLAAEDTGSLGINILIGFGVVAVSVGAIALVPTPLAGTFVGLLLFAVGFALMRMQARQWALLSQICIVIGALIAAAGAIVLGDGSVSTMLLVSLGLGAAAVLARSSLLMVAAVLPLAASLGTRTAYWHATYAFAMYEPTLTIVVFSALALAVYHLSKQLTADYARLALAAARTCVFLVNFGFWGGSLRGDDLWLLRRALHVGPPVRTFVAVIPDWAFVIGWALALIGVGAWGAAANRRWVVNVAAVFAAIHFYTQWFERLGATPLSVLMGGLILLAIGLALWAFNQRMRTAAT